MQHHSKPTLPWRSQALRESDVKEAGLILQAAAFYGYVDVLKLWRERSQSESLWTWKVCTQAAAGGGSELETLKWLRSLDPPCDWSWRTCAAAARGGHVHALKWLRGQDPPCDWAEEKDGGESACSWAAYNGELETLEWLRSQDPPCPFDNECCFVASVGGHLAVRQWLRSQQCEWPQEEGDLAGTWW